MTPDQELESRANTNLPPCVNCGHEAHTGICRHDDWGNGCWCRHYEAMTFEDVLERENSETI